MEERTFSEWLQHTENMDAEEVQKLYDETHPSKPVSAIKRILGYKKASIPDNLRWAVFERDNFTCQHCGSRRNLTVDHIVAESRGGELTMDNTQTLCRSCNSKKGAR